MGLTASGTTYITFEDVLVPIENVIGEVNKGFKIIMNNFNHERCEYSPFLLYSFSSTTLISRFS
jgi:alkylation response protein AidB-like acyl-CoA dehydrogenase